MDKIAITRRRRAARYRPCCSGSPSTAIMARTLEYALMQDDPHISSEIGSHLFLSGGQGLCPVYLGDEPRTLVKDPPREALVRLTAKGIDLMEGND